MLLRSLSAVAQSWASNPRLAPLLFDFLCHVVCGHCALTEAEVSLSGPMKTRLGVLETDSAVRHVAAQGWPTLSDRSIA